MDKPKIQVINESDVPNQQIEAIAAALQIQISRDFAPIWGFDADVTFLPTGKEKPDPDAWWLVVLKDSDQSGALGYHDLTSVGLPMGKAFAATCAQYGTSLSVDMSHECVEMAVDPDINSLVIDKAGQTIRCKEAADACEDDRFGYEIDGILVSDFCTPEWFDDQTAHPAGTKYDFGGYIKQPFQLLAGGYIGALDLSNPQLGWQDLTADQHDVAAQKQPGARYWKRIHKRTGGVFVCSQIKHR